MEIDVEKLYVDSCLEDSMFYDFGNFDKAHREVRFLKARKEPRKRNRSGQ